MAGKMTLPKKYRKLGLKQGYLAWGAVKRKAAVARKKISKVVKKVARKTTAKRKTTVTKKPTTTKRRVTTMAAKKTTPVKRRRKTGVISERTMKLITNTGLVGLSTLGSVALLNMTPMLKDLKRWQKVLFLTLTAVLGVGMAKNILIKTAFSGAGVAAAITLLLPYMPEGFSFAGRGGGRKFSRGELAELTTMGVPGLSRQHESGLPISSMGLPLNTGRASRNNYRGKRGYVKT